MEECKMDLQESDIDGEKLDDELSDKTDTASGCNLPLDAVIEVLVDTTLSYVLLKKLLS